MVTWVTVRERRLLKRWVASIDLVYIIYSRNIIEISISAYPIEIETHFGEWNEENVHLIKRGYK